jgi:hypothetical protein
MITKLPNKTPSPPPSGRTTLSRRRESSVLPRYNRSQDYSIAELPSIVHTLQPRRESNLSLAFSKTTTRLHRATTSNVDIPGTGMSSPPKSSSPATTYLTTSSAHSHHSDSLSRPSSRAFSPSPFPTQEETTALPESRPSSRTFSTSPFPTQEETTALPEVFEPFKSKLSSPSLPSPRSVQSDAGSGIFQLPSRKWPFKSRRGPKGAFNIPSATFFTSGRALLLWNEKGVCLYDLQNILSISHHIITPGDILLAAGGTKKTGIVRRKGPVWHQTH